MEGVRERNGAVEGIEGDKRRDGRTEGDGQKGWGMKGEDNEDRGMGIGIEGERWRGGQ